MSALIVVDLQEDFINGSLAVKDANSIIQPIIKLLDLNWDCVIATKDWHPQNHTSFASNHQVDPFTELEFVNPDNSTETKLQTVWPDHCVQGTDGAKLDPDFEEKLDILLPPTTAKIVTKGSLQDREYYSCFRDCWKLDNTDLKDYLKEKGVSRVVLVGLAYDYCVLNSAIDALEFGFYTYVLKDYTKSVYPEKDEETDAKYKSSGVKLINFDELHSMGLDVPITNC